MLGTVGSESLRTEYVLVSTLKKIVRSPGVTSMRIKERNRIKRMEEIKRNGNRNIFMNDVCYRNENVLENVLEQNNPFTSIKEDICNLTMPIPFLHSEHTHKGDNNSHTVSSSNSSSSSSSSNSSSSSSISNMNVDININNKLNTSTTSNQNEVVESVALASLTSVVSLLTPSPDGWTVHTGAGNTAILDPFPPLFNPLTPMPRNMSPSFLMLKNTRIPCAGPRSPSSGHSSGMHVQFVKNVEYFLIIISHFFTLQHF